MQNEALIKIFELTCLFSAQSHSKIEGALFKNDKTEFWGCLDNAEAGSSISAIDDFIRVLNTKRSKDLSQGVLYLTYVPSAQDIAKIINLGVTKLVYSGLNSLSSDVIQMLNTANVTYSMNPVVYKYPGEWWTNTLYKEAYNKVKDRKVPFTIISYNNPKVPTLKNFKVHEMTDECNWPFIIFVRDSQKELYEQSLSKYKYVTVVSFPDTLIGSAGATRRASQKWLYQQGYPIAFQGDDDCTQLTYNVPGVQLNGQPKSQYVGHVEIARVLAMWQLAMEHAIKSDNVYLSCSMPCGFSWKPDYCCSFGSYLISRGDFTNIICWNVRGLVESRIFYQDNSICGLDDKDMEIRVIESGHNLCNFPWLINGGDPMSSGQDLAYLQNRFQKCQDLLRDLHGHLPWLAFREKRNLQQVCIQMPQVRKWQKEQGFRDTDKYIYNLWNDGELLK